MPSTDTAQRPIADKLIGLAAGGFAIVGGAGIVALMLITLVGVFWRYALNNPIFGIGDLSVMTLTIVAASAVAFGATKQAHVSVNIITIFFGRDITRFTDAVMRLAAIFITGLAAYALFTKACGFEKACITENLSLEHRNFYWFLGIGMTFYMLVFVTQLVIGLRHFNGIDPNEPDE